MNMLTELKNRGVQDLLLVCCHGLKGLPDSIQATWPMASVQTCVVHLVRNSLRFASRKHWKPIADHLMRVYQAPTVKAAEQRFDEFAKEWEPIYPAMIGLWRRSWGEYTPFLDYPLEIRKLIYTTNGIESLNARFRQAIRRRGHFPNEQSGVESYPEHSRNDLRRPPRNQLAECQLHKKSDRPKPAPECNETPSTCPSTPPTATDTDTPRMIPLVTWTVLGNFRLAQRPRSRPVGRTLRASGPYLDWSGRLARYLLPLVLALVA